jgi:hypothetical protein
MQKQGAYATVFSYQFLIWSSVWLNKQTINNSQDRLKTHDMRNHGHRTFRTRLAYTGGIILGIGGDNSPWGGGVFYEGMMCSGVSSDATDRAVMANIAAMGYGK